MQELSLETQIRLVLNEIFDKRRFCAFMFTVISLTIIVVGLHWPQTYESSTTLIRDQAQVVRPLLEGTAVAGNAIQQAEIAKEVIYSNKNLATVIERAKLNVKPDGTLMDNRDLEFLRSELRSKIVIDRYGSDLLKISYTSASAEEAFLVVSIASELFIDETAQNKRDDSDEAYQFIDNQVNEYKKKLDDINRRINNFKAENVGIQVDTMQGVSARISGLDDQIRRTSLELMEAGIQMDSLVEQFAIESQKSNVQEVVNVKQQRLAEMEAKLNTLRLSYTETYPDIVQLKEQIKALQEAIAADRSNKSADGSRAVTQTGSAGSLLSQRMKRQIADQKLLIKTLEARKRDQENRLGQEISRSSQVNKIVARLEELSRDQEVTKQIYNQLLRKRENARVSMRLERENAGALFTVQEPPIVPLLPKGLRFLHFALASMVLGFGVPIGLIVAWLILDPSIRHEDSLDLEDDIAVFGSISVFRTPRETRRQKFVTAQAILLFVLTLGAVVSLSLSRYYEMI